LAIVFDIVISRKRPDSWIVYYHKTVEGQRELAQRAASVHADLVNRYIQSLNCPTEQKEKLLDAVIDTKKKKMREQAR